MKELLLKKAVIDDVDSLVAVAPDDDRIAYALIRQKESLLTGSFTVQAGDGSDVASIKTEHVLFTPAKLPVLTVSLKDGGCFTVKKEIEQLCDAMHVEGEGLAIGGNPFSKHFKLLCNGKQIAEVVYGDVGESIRMEAEDYELMAVLFAMAVELAR